MFIYLSITKYASHLDLDPYKIMSSKQMSRSMSKSTFTYLFMILKSIIKYASHLDQFKMMSSNVAKWCHQMLHCCIATTVVLEPAICEDLDLHVAIFFVFLASHGSNNKHSIFYVSKLRFKIGTILQKETESKCYRAADTLFLLMKLNSIGTITSSQHQWLRYLVLH